MRMNDKKAMFKAFVDEAREIYGPDFVPLHRPVFEGNEMDYLRECVESNFVSSMGSFVTRFEEEIATFTGAKFAVATVNGTSALHIAIILAGVNSGDEVISQPLTFIATCNAISYVGAYPVFVDVDRDTMGLSPIALRLFLENNTFSKGGELYNKSSLRRIAACVPMHTYGNPCRIKEIESICTEWGIPLIEDAAESLGSYAGHQHTGTVGAMGIFSFNGNKIITSGGGGMIVTNDAELAKRAKHLTTTAKLSHSTEFVHDEIGYNYRMPGLCAALGLAQMEKLGDFLIIKSAVAKKWHDFFSSHGVLANNALKGDISNHWFNSVTLDSKTVRDEFLEYSNSEGIMTRPFWELMPRLKMFKNCQSDSLENSKWLLDHVVAISSSVPDGALNNLKMVEKK